MEIADYTILPTTQEMVDSLKGRIRKEDQLECFAMSGFDADTGLEKSFRKSQLCWTCFYKGRPAIIFGVAKTSTLSFKGIPWLLATDDIKRMKIGVLKHSKEYIQKMLNLCPNLENYVDTRNKISKNWLQWCGFNIEAEEPLGHLHLPFHRFWLKREKYV